MTWFWLGFAGGGALAILTDHARMRQWQRREHYKAHIQAVKNREQTADLLRHTRIDAVIERSRGKAS